MRNKLDILEQIFKYLDPKSHSYTGPSAHEGMTQRQRQILSDAIIALAGKNIQPA
jgi:hypothetical protein